MDFSLTPAQLELQQRTRSFIADKIIPLERDPRATAHGQTPAPRRRPSARCALSWWRLPVRQVC